MDFDDENGLNASLWKNSAWLGTSIMTDRETPLVEIVGQMLLSKNMYFLTTTSVQQFRLVEFPYRS